MREHAELPLKEGHTDLELYQLFDNAFDSFFVPSECLFLSQT
jgi:hypothetical protein